MWVLTWSSQHLAGRGRRFCDADGNETESYPFNPNGSPEGIAALCSPNGRHLAMMPHPERCFLAWQQPWVPPSLGLPADGPGPWLRLFQNAREWGRGSQRWMMLRSVARQLMFGVFDRRVL